MATTVFHVRMPEEDKQAFLDKADNLNREPADLAREVLKATADGRVTIRLSEEERRRREILDEELYS